MAAVALEEKLRSWWWSAAAAGVRAEDGAMDAIFECGSFTGGEWNGYICQPIHLEGWIQVSCCEIQTKLLLLLFFHRN